MRSKKQKIFCTSPQIINYQNCVNRAVSLGGNFLHNNLQLFPDWHGSPLVVVYTLECRFQAAALILQNYPFSSISLQKSYNYSHKNIHFLHRSTATTTIGQCPTKKTSEPQGKSSYNAAALFACLPKIIEMQKICKVQYVCEIW